MQKIEEINLKDTVVLSAKSSNGGQDEPFGSKADNGDLNEEMGMAELLAAHESAEAPAADKNSILMAKVVSISDDGVLVDIGQKREALVQQKEFGKTIPFAVGDTISVLPLPGRRDGGLRVSWRAASEQMAWEHIEQSHKRKLSIKAKVKGETKGGLLLECENVLTGFMPASQIDVRPVRDLKKWKGQTLSVYIIEFDSRKNKLIVSRKLWLSEENQKKKSETLVTLKAGDVRKGTVTGITSFGAFVDIGGIEGLLHIGELEWARTNKVSDVLKVGQEIEVKVIKFDPESEKISLSRRELLPHPWENIETRFPVGSKLSGKVVSITDFGAFIAIAPQVEGLLHASEISWKGSQKPQELLKVGQAVEVKVISVNRDKEKISLSLKRTQENPWDSAAQKYPAGSVVKAVVSSLAAFGAFARIPEGIEGLVHVSDFSWVKRVRHPEDVLKVGQEIEVKVLEINPEKEKISFGLKQLKPNPYETYAKGKKVSGPVTQVSDSGAFVEIEPDLAAFIPASEISSEKFLKPSEILAVGQTVEAKVLSVEPKERKIVLSIKQLEKELQRAAVKKYSGSAPGPNLGELLDS